MNGSFVKRDQFYALHPSTILDNLMYCVIDKQGLLLKSVGRYLFKLESGASLNPVRYAQVKGKNENCFTPMSSFSMECDDMLFFDDANDMPIPVDTRDVVCWGDYGFDINEIDKIDILTPNSKNDD